MIIAEVFRCSLPTIKTADKQWHYAKAEAGLMVIKINVFSPALSSSHQFGCLVFSRRRYLSRLPASDWQP